METMILYWKTVDLTGGMTVHIKIVVESSDDYMSNQTV
jgi:hypothetical protein